MICLQWVRTSNACAYVSDDSSPDQDIGFGFGDKPAEAQGKALIVVSNQPVEAPVVEQAPYDPFEELLSPSLEPPKQPELLPMAEPQQVSPAPAFSFLKAVPNTNPQPSSSMGNSGSAFSFL